MMNSSAQTTTPSITYTTTPTTPSITYTTTPSITYTTTPTPTITPRSTTPTPTTPSSKLYLFTTHTFTHARATGRNGPTLDAVRRAYGNIGWAQDTTNKYLDMKKQGIQEWTVPFTGNYIIKAAGASGASTSDIGGKGAILQITVSLQVGEKIKILVGNLKMYNFIYFYIKLYNIYKFTYFFYMNVYLFLLLNVFYIFLIHLL